MKKRLSLILLVNSVAIISALLIFQNKNISDRVIIAGATILPMSSDNAEIEAVLVDKGIIAAVGDLKELTEANQDAEIIEKTGQTLLPGLIEPHTHPLASALLGATVDVSGFTHPNRISVISTLKDAADGMGISPWLIAYGWDAAAVEDLKRPSLEELDQISPERPMIILTQMMHEAYVNTAALSAVGIDPTDTNQTVHDGFARNKNGTLNGTIREIDALGIMFEKIPPAPDSATELLLRLQYNKYAKAGYTSIGIPGVVGRHSDAIGLVKKVADQKTSPLRSYLYLLKTQINKMQLGGSDDFKILGMKFWMDGSPYTGGAAVDTPYENNKFTIERLGIPANHKGALNFSPADLQAMISEYHAKGYQIAAHVQGERAARSVIDAISKAQKDNPNLSLRHRLEHNALITDELLARAKDQNISVGFFVDHLTYYGDTLPKIFGDERMTRYMPVKSAFEKGLIVTLHGDHPSTPIDPFLTLQTATTRLSRSGQTVSGKNEKISIYQALQAMTINAARQLGQDDEIGSIEIGKRADFTFLSANPLTMAPEALHTIEAMETWKDGQPVNTSPVNWQNIKLGFNTLIEILSR